MLPILLFAFKCPRYTFKFTWWVNRKKFRLGRRNLGLNWILCVLFTEGREQLWQIPRAFLWHTSYSVHSNFSHCLNSLTSPSSFLSQFLPLLFIYTCHTSPFFLFLFSLCLLTPSLILPLPIPPSTPCPPLLPLQSFLSVHRGPVIQSCLLLSIFLLFNHLCLKSNSTHPAFCPLSSLHPVLPPLLSPSHCQTFFPSMFF